jgi:hypothetical protein
MSMAHRHKVVTLEIPEQRNGIIAVLSDTHGRPHPDLFFALEQHRPCLILHAGDVGDVGLLKELEAFGRTVYVRGNIDPAGPLWPDSITLSLKVPGGLHFEILLLHIAVARLRLNKSALDLLEQYPAQIVAFGHSHVPFIGMEGKIGLFNPGSAGPSRMGLPTTMGVIELRHGSLRFKHLDLKTGKEWTPK